VQSVESTILYCRYSMPVRLRSNVIGSEVPVMCQQCPSNPGILVRQCDRGYVLVASAKQLA
jgi:hypothetical protein